MQLLCNPGRADECHIQSRRLCVPSTATFLTKDENATLAHLTQASSVWLWPFMEHI